MPNYAGGRVSHVYDKGTGSASERRSSVKDMAACSTIQYRHGKALEVQVQNKTDGLIRRCSALWKKKGGGNASFRPDCSQSGVVWCGVVWCGVVWCGVVWVVRGGVIPVDGVECRGGKAGVGLLAAGGLPEREQPCSQSSPVNFQSRVVPS